MGEKRYIDKDIAKAKFEEWGRLGRPVGCPLYNEIWDITVNAVKACIGKIQGSRGIRIQDYDDKVMDSVLLVFESIRRRDAVPDNIVTYVYWYVFGSIFGTKAIQSDFENSCASYEHFLEKQHQ